MVIGKAVMSFWGQAFVFINNYYMKNVNVLLKFTWNKYVFKLVKLQKYAKCKLKY